MSVNLMEPEPMPAEDYVRYACVVDVVDATTLVMDVFLGFRCMSRQRVRVAGLVFPENENQAPEDIAAGRAWAIMFLKTGNRRVMVKTHGLKHDRRCRYCVDVWRVADGKDFAAEAMAEGHARLFVPVKKKVE